MEHDDPPKEPRSPQEKSTPPPAPTPTEGEMSRIAREAVRQPPDPRLDKELARMGLMDPEPAEARPGQRTGQSVEVGPELERLRKEYRRLQTILYALVAAIGILAVIVVLLLVR
jgi:hypothetical protein